MESDGYPFRLQKRSAADMAVAASTPSQAVETASLAYNSLGPSGTNSLFSHPYTISVRQSSAFGGGSQTTYATVYPESSQRSTTIATLMAPPGEPGVAVNGHSEFDQAVCDFDAPLHGMAMNGSLLHQYGMPPSSNAPICDHRSPLLLPALAHSATPESGGNPSVPHGYSHPSASAAENPFYSPLMSSSAHTMTSYSGITSSSHTPPAAFSNPAPTRSFFDMPASPRLETGHEGAQHVVSFHRTGQQITEPRPSLMKASIPMSKPDVGWGFSGFSGPPTHRSSPSSSFNTPILSSRVPCAGPVVSNIAGTRRSTSVGSTLEPYGSTNGRSPSVAPHLGASNADLGSSSESKNSVVHESVKEVGKKAILLPAPASSVLQDVGSGWEAHAQQPQGPEKKKKKKSKMHACEVCGKKFPRPSGLKTHMNTHNNARPYACGFPGCTRTFGVRSNAKRHLRTHGVIPPPAIHNSASGEAAYVVGFSPPVVAPGSNDPSCDLSDGNPHFSGNIGTKAGEQASDNRKRAPFFRLRWMPPSLTSRTNANKLRVVDEVTGEVSDDEDDSEEADEDGMGSDRDEYDQGPSGYGSGNEDGGDGTGGAYDGKGTNPFPSAGGIVLPSLPASYSLGTGSAGFNLSSSYSSTPSSFSHMNSSMALGAPGYGLGGASGSHFYANRDNFFGVGVGVTPTHNHRLLASA